MTQIVKKIPRSTGRLIKRKNRLPFRPVAIVFEGPAPFDVRQRN